MQQVARVEAGGVIGSSEIVVVRSDGSGRRALTSNGVDDANPAWAPGGRRLVFVRYVRGRNAEIYVVGVDGRGRERLTRSRLQDFDPSWSSTGGIAWVRAAPSGHRPLP